MIGIVGLMKQAQPTGYGLKMAEAIAKEMQHEKTND